VSVFFCGDRRMAALNGRWRRRSRPTDVLSFPAGGATTGFLGDIVISVPYATRQARRRGETPAREIDRLLLHGYLHLLGYDHETDQGEMEALEGRLRARLRIEEKSPLASAASRSRRSR
jgi:rRNA maturation RNase YbeY